MGQLQAKQTCLLEGGRGPSRKECTRVGSGGRRCSCCSRLQQEQRSSRSSLNWSLALNLQKSLAVQARHCQNSCLGVFKCSQNSIRFVLATSCSRSVGALPLDSYPVRKALTPASTASRPSAGVLPGTTRASRPARSTFRASSGRKRWRTEPLIQERVRLNSAGRACRGRTSQSLEARQPRQCATPSWQNRFKFIRANRLPTRFDNMPTTAP